jgi:hypothetical protein
MRSLKKEEFCKNAIILGINIRVGKWYKITIRDDMHKFWLARFYGVDDNNFIHKNITYVVYSNHYRYYESFNGKYHHLCGVEEITTIDMVDINYINDMIKKFG